MTLEQIVMVHQGDAEFLAAQQQMSIAEWKLAGVREWGDEWILVEGDPAGNDGATYGTVAGGDRLSLGSQAEPSAWNAG